jgi:hypothetical protein
MKKTRISNGDLTFIFTEKLRAFDECGQAGIAIVQDGTTWRAVLTHGKEQTAMLCRRRMELIQKQLREIYILKED